MRSHSIFLPPIKSMPHTFMPDGFSSGFAPSTAPSIARSIAFCCGFISMSFPRSRCGSWRSARHLRILEFCNSDGGTAVLGPLIRDRQHKSRATSLDYEDEDVCFIQPQNFSTQGLTSISQVHALRG